MLGSLISDCMECERTLPIKDYGVVFDEVNTVLREPIAPN